MESLFVFQFVFLGLLAMCVILSLRRYGVIGTAFAFYTNGLIGILLITIIVNRIYYNTVIRDSRNWNQIRFKEDGTLGSGLKAGDSDMIAYATTYAKSNTTPGASVTPAGCPVCAS